MVAIDECLEVAVSHIERYLSGLNLHFHNAVVHNGETAAGMPPPARALGIAFKFKNLRIGATKGQYFDLNARIGERVVAPDSMFSL